MFFFFKGLYNFNHSSLSIAYREAFSIYDKNGDSKITLDEFGDVIRSLGLDPTKDQLSELMKEIDLDGKLVILCFSFNFLIFLFK